MAREPKNTDSVEAPQTTTPVEGAAPVAAAPTAPAAKGQHMIKLTVDGVEITRKDYILKLAGEGKSRSEITAKVREVTGNPEFRYQIVFQATKDLSQEQYPGLRGGHPKKAVAPVAPAPAEGTPQT